MDKRILISFIGIVILNAIAIMFVNVELPKSQIAVFLIMALFEIVVVYAVFSLTDLLVPKPSVQELNVGEKFTQLWKSSSFWVFLLLTVGGVSEIFFGYSITEIEAKEVINSNWGSVLQTLLGIFMIVMRKENKLNNLTPIE